MTTKRSEEELPQLNGSAPKILASSGYAWWGRMAGATLLDNGELVLCFLITENGVERKTMFKLSPTAAIKTVKSISDVYREADKPIGWSPDQNI